jgi:iron(III) transport system substrate-binding protein
MDDEGATTSAAPPHSFSYASTILKNPPHPNAARLMADFYLSDEAQGIYARSGHGITIADLREQLPADIAKLANVPPLVE